MVKEPEILKASKEMMIALRKLRDEEPAQWDALLATPAAASLMNAWDRMKMAIITAEKQLFYP